MSTELEQAIEEMYNTKERADKEHEKFLQQMAIQQATFNTLSDVSKKVDEDLTDLLNQI